MLVSERVISIAPRGFEPRSRAPKAQHGTPDIVTTKRILFVTTITGPIIVDTKRIYRFQIVDTTSPVTSTSFEGFYYIDSITFDEILESKISDSQPIHGFISTFQLLYIRTGTRSKRIVF